VALENCHKDGTRIINCLHIHNPWHRSDICFQKAESRCSQTSEYWAKCWISLWTVHHFGFSETNAHYSCAGKIQQGHCCYFLKERRITIWNGN
jgi:hypothetical protein